MAVVPGSRPQGVGVWVWRGQAFLGQRRLLWGGQQPGVQVVRATMQQRRLCPAILHERGQQGLWGTPGTAAGSSTTPGPGPPALAQSAHAQNCLAAAVRQDGLLVLSPGQLPPLAETHEPAHAESGHHGTHHERRHRGRYQQVHRHQPCAVI